MKNNQMCPESHKILQELFVRQPALGVCREGIEQAFYTLKQCFLSGGKLMVAGNGGSASDSEHIVGELVKSFKKHRPLSADFRNNLLALGEEGKALAEGLQGGLPAISLCGHVALSTAFGNDCDPRMLYAQLVEVWGNRGDVLMTISTSGNSANCVYAAVAAKAKGIPVVSLLGGSGGKLRTLSDVSIVVPASETFAVQEYHLPVYHCLCAMLEAEFFQG